MSRHLKEVHGWQANDAKYELARRGERKTFASKQRPLRTCPVDGCSSMNRRIPGHLKDVHQITGEEYKRLLARSKLFESNPGQAERTISNHHSTENNDTIENEKCSKEGLLREFMKYSLSIDGIVALKTAKQDIQEIKSILCALNSQKGFAVLFDRIRIRDDFLNGHCKRCQQGKGFKAKTIKRYLNALKHFYQFIISENVNVLPTTKDDLVGLLTLLDKWSKNLNSQADSDKTRERDRRARNAYYTGAFTKTPIIGCL